MSRRLKVADLLLGGDLESEPLEAFEALLQETRQQGNAHGVEIVARHILGRSPAHATAKQALAWAEQEQREQLPQFLESPGPGTPASGVPGSEAVDPPNAPLVGRAVDLDDPEASTSPTITLRNVISTVAGFLKRPR